MWITCEYIVFLFFLVNLAQKTYYAHPFTHFKVKQWKELINQAESKEQERMALELEMLRLAAEESSALEERKEDSLLRSNVSWE